MELRRQEHLHEAYMDFIRQLKESVNPEGMREIQKAYLADILLQDILNATMDGGTLPPQEYFITMMSMEWDIMEGCLSDLMYLAFCYGWLAAGGAPDGAPCATGALPVNEEFIAMLRRPAEG